MQLLAALALGFLGSFHCIGMCGPIAMALPQRENSSIYYKAFQSLSYNLGRVITYGFLGLLLGALGKGLFLGGLQQVVSITTGVLIVLIVLFPVILPRSIKQASFFQFTWFRKIFSTLIQSKNHLAFLFLGVINGFLPCGFVYIGLSAALLTGDPINASLFMMAFGLGTIPALFTLSLMGSFISLNFRNKIKKAIPVFSILVGVILILRGMNLGIPYISPMIEQHAHETKVDCCEKPEKTN